MKIKTSGDAVNIFEPELRELKQNLLKTVKALSHDIGERNVYDNPKLEAARKYIAGEFRRCGYTPAEQTYRLNTEFTHINMIDCANIAAELKGSRKPEEIIIIGAHYDTLYGTPGADDNASGVAGLLELARLASKAGPYSKTVRFVAFANEEPPFFKTPNMGSTVYAKQLKKDKANVKAMICLEMIGYYSGAEKSQRYPLPVLKLFYPSKADFVSIVGNFSSFGLVSKTRSAFRKHSKFRVESITMFTYVPGIDFSDQYSFWKEGYKAVMVSDTAFYRNPNYHGASDTYDTLDYQKMAETVKGLHYVIYELAQ
ncbi:MAG: M28 family peptidase [Elusimicrobiota bacterium]